MAHVVAAFYVFVGVGIVSVVITWAIDEVRRIEQDVPNAKSKMYVHHMTGTALDGGGTAADGVNAAAGTGAAGSGGPPDDARALHVTAWGCLKALAKVSVWNLGVVLVHGVGMMVYHCENEDERDFAATLYWLSVTVTMVGVLATFRSRPPGARRSDASG